MMAWRSYTPCNVNCTYLHIFNERGISHSFDSNWPTSKQEEKFVGARLKRKLENYESEDDRLQYFLIKKLAKISFHGRTLRSHLYGLGHTKQLYPRVCVVVVSFILFLCNIDQPFTLGSRARLGKRDNSLSELSRNFNSAYRVYVFTYKRSMKLHPGKGCLGYPRLYNKVRPKRHLQVLKYVVLSLSYISVPWVCIP